MEKDYLSIKKVVESLRNSSKIKTLGTCSNICQFVSCCGPYVQVNSLNCLPSLVSSSRKKAREKQRKLEIPLFFTVCLNVAFIDN